MHRIINENEDADVILFSTSHGNMAVYEQFDFCVKMKKKRGKLTVRQEENYTKIWNKNIRSQKLANIQI